MAVIEGDDYSNTLAGTSGADEIYGYGGADRLYGYGGDDVLYGGDGTDELFGGDGDDTLIPGSNTYYDWVKPGTGDDIVDFSASTAGEGFYNIVHNDLSVGITVTINAVKNTGTIDKGTAGTNTILSVNTALAFGDDGGLRIIGTAQDDTYAIRLKANQMLEIREMGGSDTIKLQSAKGYYSLSYTWEYSGVTADLTGKTRTVLSNDTGDVDTISGKGHLYRFRATDYDDTVYGSEYTLKIYTYDGDDFVSIKSNIVDEFSWVDVGAGDDTIDLSGVTAGTAFYNIVNDDIYGPIAVTINSSKDLATIVKGTGGSEGTTTILSVTNALAFQDIASYYYYDNEVGGLRIIGTDNDDSYTIRIRNGEHLQIREYGGSDTIKIVGDKGYVVLSYRYGDSGITANLAKGTITNNDTGDVGNITGTGHVDELRGTYYTDKLLGSSEDEAFVTFDGDDIVDGKGGTDTVGYSYSDSISDLIVNLATGTATFERKGTSYEQTLKNIENIHGTSSKDVLKGDSGANELSGKAGNDKLFGQGGDDTLVGGAGKDTLTGGKGADTFVFSDDSGKDKIKDFSSVDTIDLADVTEIESYADLTASHMTQDGKNVVIDDGDGTVITLLNVSSADLTADNFLF